MTELLDFSDALRAMQAGKKIARTGWNGSGMFAYRIPAASYPARTEVARAYWADKQAPQPENTVSPIMVPYNAYFALKTAQNTVSTWVPSSTDLDAKDWHVVD